MTLYENLHRFLRQNESGAYGIVIYSLVDRKRMYLEHVKIYAITFVEWL